MAELDNVQMMKNVMNALISTSGRKTDHGHAMMTMDTLIKQLEPQFHFLKNVHIQEKIYSESTEIVSIMSDINTVKPSDMGKAIHALIINLHEKLGDAAGHFFFKEIKQTLGDDNVSRMTAMGVDFTRMQINDEITHMGRMHTQQKQ